MWTVEPLVVTIEERNELERRVRAQTTAHRDRQRAQVVLLAADRVAGRKIAHEVGLSPVGLEVASALPRPGSRRPR